METCPERWIIVTPCRNEAQNLRQLALSLAEQTYQCITLWVIVDDGSTDDTSQVASVLTTPFPIQVLRRMNSGGLAGGSEYEAWWYGVETGLRVFSNPTRVMKLDADMVLPSDYFEHMAGSVADLIGGLVWDWGSREQRHHIPGALKAYNLRALEVLRGLPKTIGLDVLDEIALERAGLQVAVIHDALVRTARPTGSSEGFVRGRVRNGRVLRWVGYNPVYFCLHVARYLVRRPVVLGGVLVVYGYATAGAGPYPVWLKRAHAQMQRRKLRSLMRNPIKWIRETYFY